MNVILRHTLSFALGSALLAIPAFAVPQGQDSGQQDPAKTQPPAVQRQSQQQLGSEQPVPQQDTVNPKNSKDDVEAIGNRKVSCHMNWFSLEKEIGLGKQLAQEVERSSKMIDDPVVTEYVNQLAGVMAHEISHVTARHGTCQATKGELMQLASIPAMIFIPYTMAGYALYQGLNMAIPLTFLKFSRDAEREADFLGIQYMYKAGYDPNSYVTFFERVQADEKRRPGTIPKVFSTHPPTPERIANTQKEIARILPARQEYIVTTSEFDQVKGRLRNIMFSRKVTEAKDKPTLRSKTEQSKKQPTGNDPNSTTDDDRPTLKRRPDSQP